jgi:hypothetical protein
MCFSQCEDSAKATSYTITVNKLPSVAGIRLLTSFGTSEEVYFWIELSVVGAEGPGGFLFKRCKKLFAAEIITRRITVRGGFP